MFFGTEIAIVIEYSEMSVKLLPIKFPSNLNYTRIFWERRLILLFCFILFLDFNYFKINILFELKKEKIL